MFERGVFFDDNWISDGHFFCQVDKVRNHNFMGSFREQEKGATIELSKLSNKFNLETRDGNLICVLLSGSQVHYPVQVCYLEAVGVELDDSDNYIFKLNPETKTIFVYGEYGDLIGGLMPIVIGE
jgi:hypothetical protein